MLRFPTSHLCNTAFAFGFNLNTSPVALLAIWALIDQPITKHRAINELSNGDNNLIGRSRARPIVGRKEHNISI